MATVKATLPTVFKLIVAPFCVHKAIVHNAITVVVSPITNFFFWLPRRTLPAIPTATNVCAAASLASSAIGVTRGPFKTQVLVHFVNQAIAVVVYPVANFLLWDACVTFGPACMLATGDTYFHALTSPKAVPVLARPLDPVHNAAAVPAFRHALRAITKVVAWAAALFTRNTRTDIPIFTVNAMNPTVAPTGAAVFPHEAAVVRPLAIRITSASHTKVVLRNGKADPVVRNVVARLTAQDLTKGLVQRAITADLSCMPRCDTRPIATATVGVVKAVLELHDLPVFIFHIDGKIFVNVPITVVIQAIADVFPWGFPNAAHTLAKGVTDLDPRTGAKVVANSAALPTKALVNDPVTVVVNPVTNFKLWGLGAAF